MNDVKVSISGGNPELIERIEKAVSETVAANAKHAEIAAARQRVLESDAEAARKPIADFERFTREINAELAKDVERGRRAFAEELAEELAEQGRAYAELAKVVEATYLSSDAIGLLMDKLT